MAAVNPAGPEPMMTTLWTVFILEKIWIFFFMFY